MVHMVRIAKTSPRASGPLGLHSDAGASHCEVRASRSLSFTHSLNSRSDMSKYTILSRGFTLAAAAALLCVASAAATSGTSNDSTAQIAPHRCYLAMQP